MSQQSQLSQLSQQSRIVTSSHGFVTTGAVFVTTCHNFRAPIPLNDYRISASRKTDSMEVQNFDVTPIYKKQIRIRGPE